MKLMEREMLKMKTIQTALTIAGTDPTGGAGIQADLKTFQELKSYGMSVITSVVAQNTTGVKDVHHQPLSMIEKQLDAVIEDISVDAVKSGMIANIDMMKIIKKKIVLIKTPYVLDPVMVATSGDPLIAEEARDFLKKELLPLATVVTPNIPEAEFLLQRDIHNTEDMKQAAYDLVTKYKAKAALVKGGHLKEDATDYLYDGTAYYTLSERRVATNNTHGTGCTLAAAITSYLSQGFSLVKSVQQAKKYVTLAIQHSFDLGHGSGPTNHWAPRVTKEVQQ